MRSASERFSAATEICAYSQMKNNMPSSTTAPTTILRGTYWAKLGTVSTGEAVASKTKKTIVTAMLINDSDQASRVCNFFHLLLMRAPDSFLREKPEAYWDTARNAA